MREERRNIRTRSALVQQVINSVVQNPSVTLSVNTLQQWLWQRLQTSTATEVRA